MREWYRTVITAMIAPSPVTRFRSPFNWHICCIHMIFWITLIESTMTSHEGSS